MERPDDAGVYRLSDELALVQTVDFFTPIVDDPYTYGRIAAANSLSDVYAMGAKPLTALNVVCFPAKQLDIDVLSRVLAGGLDTCREAGCALLGGHSVDDKEFKFGLAVTGTVHPDRLVSARGARAGDVLVLTKPLGTGFISTAHKQGAASEAAVAASIESMSTLNARAAEAMQAGTVHACTDVTGFGLLGHASDMVGETTLDFVIEAGALPLLPDALALAEGGFRCGGLGRNRDYYGHLVDVADAVSPALQDLLYDPQTSGGLLIALPPADADALVRDVGATRIGVVESGSGRIRVRG